MSRASSRRPADATRSAPGSRSARRGRCLLRTRQTVARGEVSVMWFFFLRSPARFRSQPVRAGVAPRRAPYRLRLEALEHRLLPGDALLGAALGSFWLTLGPSVLDADPLPARIAGFEEFPASHRPAPPADLLIGDAVNRVAAPAPSPAPPGPSGTTADAQGGDTATRPLQTWRRDSSAPLSGADDDLASFLGLAFAHQPAPSGHEAAPATAVRPSGGAGAFPTGPAGAASPGPAESGAAAFGTA